MGFEEFDQLLLTELQDPILSVDKDFYGKIVEKVGLFFSGLKGRVSYPDNTYNVFEFTFIIDQDLNLWVTKIVDSPTINL